MATNAKAAFGAVLQMSDVNGANHQTIAELKDFNFNISTKTEDATAHSSGDPWTVDVPTLNSISISATVNWVPNNATQNSTTGVVYVQKQRQSRNYKIIDPDLGELVSFDAFITGFDGGFPVAGLKNAKINFKGSGIATFSI
jgi:hypothetical protein